MDSFKIIKQKWNDHTKYIVIDEKTESSIQLNVYNQSEYGSAYIYALYVPKEYRRKGIATALLTKAEEIIKSHGYNSVALDWHDGESELFVNDLYRKCGYQLTQASYIKYL